MSKKDLPDIFPDDIKNIILKFKKKLEHNDKLINKKIEKALKKINDNRKKN
jgi:hypothetical protein